MQRRPLRPSATLAIHERSQALAASGRDIFRLGFGESPFPIPDSIVAALRQHAAASGYLPVAGDLGLRQAIAATLRSYGPEDILVGPGSKILIANAIRVSGATILLPRPSWVSYEPQAVLADRPVVWLDTTLGDGWRLRPETLDDALQQIEGRALLVLNHPNNPAGTTLGPERLQELAEVARRHDLTVLSDEIYGRLHHQGQHSSMAEHYPEGTILTGGLSKWCGAGGWRLGWCAIPKRWHPMRDAMVTIASETYSSASAPVQLAACAAYQASPALDDYLDRARRVLTTLGTHVGEALGSASPRLEGGFYAYPDWSDWPTAQIFESSEDLVAQVLEETGVALLPGTAFGHPPQRLVTRLAYVDFDGHAALTQAHRSVGAIAPRVVEGIERLTTWMVCRKTVRRS